MKILLLAGTSEAREIASQLAEAKIEAIASIAGATKRPLPLALETRTGGYGGEAGQIKFLQDNKITAIIDATHPFAEKITARTSHIARRLGLPCLHLIRPPWEPEEGDKWTFIASEEEAAKHIPVGTNVFLATGRKTLDKFDNLPDRFLLSRQIDQPEGAFPFPGGTFLIARPPFTFEDEVALFTSHNVGVLVVKNAGGTASKSKLIAARKLGIPVLMISRPSPPQGEVVSTVQAALNWVRTLT